MNEANLIDVVLGRLVIIDGQDRQYLYLVESGGERSFQIVIGNNEAAEIHRVLHNLEPPRPLTHKLAHDVLEALKVKLTTVDITALKQNTFYARVNLANEAGEPLAQVDARPSDAIALALRSHCRIRVDERVLDEASRNGDA